MVETIGADYAGMLAIGDPHLEGRSPGFRKDNYPEVILEKFAWSLNYARSHRLLPVLLGDLFDKPRDNPTWMIGRLIELLGSIECIGVYGNHDCADPELCEHDSLSLLTRAGRVRLVSASNPWRGVMNGRQVVIGGASHREPIPTEFDAGPNLQGIAPFVVWLTHHDLIVPGYEEQGYLRPGEINRIDLVINGHIHRRLESVQKGKTLWITPGNISRRTRNEAERQHQPSVLRIDVGDVECPRKFIEVPHEPFEDVFYDIVEGESVGDLESAFVAGLAQLQTIRTQDGSGLQEFLEKNLEQFEDQVASEILALAKEVMSDGEN